MVSNTNLHPYTTYAIPAPASVAKWVARTPKDFQFLFKARCCPSGFGVLRLTSRVGAGRSWAHTAPTGKALVQQHRTIPENLVVLEGKCVRGRPRRRSQHPPWSLPVNMQHAKSLISSIRVTPFFSTSFPCRRLGRSVRARSTCRACPGLRARSCWRNTKQVIGVTEII